MIKPGVVLSHIVPEGIAGIRLSDYAAGIYPGLETKSGVKKTIKRGELFVNNKQGTTATHLEANFVLEWRKPILKPSRIFRLDAEVIFEDEHFAVVNKPAGIVVSGNRFRTLENALPGILQESILPDALSLPHAIHRLDCDTSGLVIVGKTAGAHLKLSRMMESGEISKTYIALVIGKLPVDGVFSDKVDGKDAVTRFRLLKVYPSLVSGYLSLANLFPETGRTHQIRKHLSGAGFPILGDKLYGDPEFLLKHKGLFLCAYGLNCLHPYTGEKLELTIAAPSKFYKFPESEKRRFEKYGGI